MPKPIDDISTQDPFEAETEETTFSQDVISVHVDKAKRATGDYVKSTAKRLLWSIPLIFSLANEHEKDRILDKLERGEKVGKAEFFFGKKPTLWSMIRILVFLIFVTFIVIVLLQNGLLDQITALQSPQ